MKYTFISWNVNGIRAAEKKGFVDWLEGSGFDSVSVQETKVSPETKLSERLQNPHGYKSYWDYATEKKGYSGVATYVKEELEPVRVINQFSDPILSKEGRLLELDYGDWSFFNIYFPNGKASPLRLEYKMEFYKQFLKYITKLTKGGRGVIFCGDVNTAHQEIDLARPKENSKISGFLPEEREWIDKLIDAGFTDTLRMFHQEPKLYSWWDVYSHARERNIGWRIDYFFVSEDLKDRVKDAFILDQVFGSDHAPVGITIDL